MLRAVVIACVMTVCSGPGTAAQQTAPAPAAPTASDAGTVIHNVKAVARADGADIEITANAPLKAQAARLSHPDRLVLDFADTTVHEPGRIDLHQGPVLRVRAAQFSLSPRVARVVIDLRKPSEYRLEDEGARLVVKVSAPPSAKAKPAASPGTVAKPSNAATPKQAQPKPPPEAPAKSKEPAPEKAAPHTTTLRDITVDISGGNLQLRIALSGPVSPQVSTLDHPERIVLDFANTSPGEVQSRVAVNDARLRAARVSLFKKEPPVTRVVLDVATTKPLPQVSSAADAVLVAWPADAVAQSGKTAQPPVVVRAVPPPPMRPAAAPATATPTPDTPTEVSPLAPAEAPQPMRLLKVTAADKLLTVVAQHCTFGDVLHEIASGTGAQLAFASANVEAAFARESTQEVAVKLGPASAREVVSNFLQGSGFDFIITETNRGLQTILLTARRGGTADSGAVVSGPHIAAARAVGSAPAPVQSVRIISPAANTTVKGQIVLTAATSGNFVSLQFKLDGFNLGRELTSMPYSMSWRSDEVPDGTHILTATARDAQGNTITGQPVSINVNNGPPQVP